MFLLLQTNSRNPRLSRYLNYGIISRFYILNLLPVHLLHTIYSNRNGSYFTYFLSNGRPITQ